MVHCCILKASSRMVTHGLSRIFSNLVESCHGRPGLVAMKYIEFDSLGWVVEGNHAKWIKQFTLIRLNLTSFNLSLIYFWSYTMHNSCIDDQNWIPATVVFILGGEPSQVSCPTPQTSFTDCEVSKEGHTCESESAGGSSAWTMVEFEAALYLSPWISTTII